ncbi:MAG: tyrosine-type recombinase/integrase [Methylobacter sp.]
MRNAKPIEKPYKIADEKGMYLLVHPNGRKYFRLNYRCNGKRQTLALDVYPVTSLKDAREKRDTAIKQIAGGINPSVSRKIEKAGVTENTFKAVAEEFLEANSVRWSASHKRHIQDCFERDVYPWLDSRPLKNLSTLSV